MAWLTGRQVVALANLHPPDPAEDEMDSFASRWWATGSSRRTPSCSGSRSVHRQGEQQPQPSRPALRVPCQREHILMQLGQPGLRAHLVQRHLPARSAHRRPAGAP